ncbi:EF-hand domain-containing protein, partial [Roseovarius nitratireducens]|uniref:EF-hand domain-containing protein n=2 Tax=Roseovarius nitratireducens TaxID=2044597 RepID=UPI000CE271EA
MRTDLKNIAGLGAVLAALAAGPAVAQGMGDWDTDGDGLLSQDEYVEGWRLAQGEQDGTFSKWDQDNDGVLTEAEFNAGVFMNYDRDRSGMIEKPEFEKADRDIREGFWKQL